MKFFVLALCVCAASAASFGASSFGTPSYGGSSYGAARKPFRGFAQATAQVAPKAVVAPARVAPAPVVPAAVVPAPVVPAPVVPAPVAPVAVAKTYKDESGAQVVRSDSEVSANGYNYLYETENGISAQATGVLKAGAEGEVVVSQGSYKYYSPDGTPVEITYIADENGYQPQGNVLPVAPEIPEAILRSLAYIASQPQTESVKKF